VRHKTKRTEAPINREAAEPVARKRNSWIAPAVAAVVIAAAAAAFFALRPAPGPPTALAPPVSSQAASPDKTDHEGQARLVGRWLRPDGGYILEIRSAAPDGKLDAAYFNPRPIHVARAEWKARDGKLSVFVELRDVNYPGSTYSLQFLDAKDQMAGTYFQAAQQMTFDVEFVRMR